MDKKQNRRPWLSHVILVSIFFLFAFLRFYNLDKQVPFGWDQEQFSTQIREIVKNHEFTLLGPRVNNDLGFFLAPYFTYLLIPFYLLTNLDPQALYYFLIFFNTVAFFLIFVIIEKIFSIKYSLWFLIFWTINPAIQKYDKVPWWPIFIPLGVIIIWYLLHKIYQKPQENKNLLFLGLSLGFFINMHFQFVFMVFFSFLFLLITYWKKLEFIKKILLTLGTFILTFFPLFIFDLRHKFLNTRLFFDFFTKGTDSQAKDLWAWIPVFRNVLKPYIYLGSNLLMYGFFFLVLLLLFLLIRHKNKFLTTFYLSSLLLWLLFTPLFALYGKRPSEYYFLFLYPFITITIINSFLMIKKEIFLGLLGIVFIVINFTSFQLNLNEDPLGLYYKKKIIKEIKTKHNNKKFFVSFYGRSIDVGFKYLFDLYDIHPEDNYNPLIQIGFPPVNETQRIGGYGITIPKGL